MRHLLYKLKILIFRHLSFESLEKWSFFKKLQFYLVKIFSFKNKT